MGRRSAKAYDALLHALVMTDQEHAAQVLDRNRTMELVRIRNAERNSGFHTVTQPSSSSFASPSAVVPSGSPVVSTSSSVAPSFPVPSSSKQGQFVPSGMYLCTSASVHSLF